MRTEIILTMAWMLSLATIGAAFEARPAGETYAIIVNGIGKDPEDRIAREGVVNGLRVYLRETARVAPDRLAVLTSEADASARSAAERIRNTIAAFAGVARSNDRFVFYYIGQANAVGDALRLNVPGPDITQNDLAKWLAGVKVGTQLVVLDCPRAGLAAKALSHPGRAIVLASTDQEAYAPRFGSHFVPALVDPESDANEDGRISVLEAFTAAARQIEQWYQQMQILPTETPGIEDDGDGRPSQRPWRFDQDGGDGGLAATMVLAVGT